MLIKIVPFATLLLFCTGISSAQNATLGRKITTEELKSSAEIVGPLGVRIGKIVSIEAIAETTGDKIVSRWLTVDKIDGKKLAKPIRMEYSVYNWANVEKLKNAKRLTLNVYQQIGMRGIPKGVIEQTVPVATGWEYGLHTWIVVVNQTAPKPFSFPNKFYDHIDGGHPLEKKTEKK